MCAFLWVGMLVIFVMFHVCPCDPCVRVSRVSLLCIPAPPGVFLPVVGKGRGGNRQGPRRQRPWQGLCQMADVASLEALIEPATVCGCGPRPDGRGLVGLDGCEVRLCDPCARVSRVCPGSPGVFLPVVGSLSVRYSTVLVRVKKIPNSLFSIQRACLTAPR